MGTFEMAFRFLHTIARVLLSLASNEKNIKKNNCIDMRFLNVWNTVI